MWKLVYVENFKKTEGIQNNDIKVYVLSYYNHLFSIKYELGSTYANIQLSYHIEPAQIIDKYHIRISIKNMIDLNNKMQEWLTLDGNQLVTIVTKEWSRESVPGVQDECFEM